MSSMLPRTTSLLGATLCALALLAVPASATNAPLEGLWDLGQGETIEFNQTSANHFKGTIRVNGKTSCPGNLNGVQLTGSASHYTGTSRFYLQDGCQFFGNGDVDITLSEDALNGQYVGNPPPQATCCDETLQMKRENTATEPELPALVNSILVGLQKRYKQLVRTHGSKTRKKRLKALGAAGRSGRRRVDTYKARSDEKKLKACAVSALTKVEQGAKVKTERAGRGLSALAKCLKSFADDLPNGRPGTAAPPPAQPGGAIVEGHYVGQNNSGQRAGSFSFDEKGSFVGNFAFSMWFRSFCNGGHGDGFAPFSTPQKRPLGGDGRFTYTLASAELRIDITGLVSGGRASGTVSVTDLQDSRCSTGTVRWATARR
ncbi:MAG: hypothetical protein QOH76_2328 [Thermoleophilaceae bacterium]|jgi:hypothetical protein|nr:hypothetical protein [Thermoleophilaceae bacterium]